MKQIQVYNTTLCDGTQVMENAVAMPISARLFPISNGNERRIAYKFGDVILVPFPFTDQSTSKKRPAIVISSDLYNRCKPDLILIAVTSQVNKNLALSEVLIND